MIDSSKKRNSLVGVKVLSPYVIERRSKTSWYATSEASLFGRHVGSLTTFTTILFARDVIVQVSY